MHKYSWTPTTLTIIRAQVLRPSVIVSQEGGVVTSKIVYFGYADCNKSDCELTKSLMEDPKNLKVKINSLNEEVEILRNLSSSMHVALHIAYSFSVIFVNLIIFIYLQK